ncbi:hypothetical protein MACJ_002534 [Theileria orientalis]|uniref:6-Cys domain-containing protein n=1 Tax=Theileria orientalis TaxID=68886 RepID=A0A976M8R7_THEOR|nr:hypothetical protein MACJ_002534 [Theileria orientalis]
MSGFLQRFVFLFVLLLNLQKFVFSDTDSENKLYISLLKIVTEGESGRRVNDRKNYVLEELGPSYHFAIRNEAKCIEVAYGENVLYQYNEVDGYPKAISVHLDLNEIYLQVGKSVRIYQRTNDLWNIKTLESIDDISEQGLQVITSDRDAASHRVRTGVSVNYYLDGIQCSEVKYKNNTLWAHGKNSEYPNRVYFNVFKRICIINFPGSYMVLNYLENGSNVISDVKIVRDGANITIVTEDTSKSTHKENEITKYYLKEYAFVSNYLFNDETKCVELKHGKNVFWRHADNIAAGYPKSLCFHRDLNLLFLELNDSINTYKCLESGCMVIKNIPLDGFTESDLTIVTQNESDSITANNDPSAYNIEPFGFGTEYVFKKGNNCVAIEFGGKPVWTRDNGEYEGKLPRKLFFHIYTRMIILDFAEFYLIYEFQNNQFHLLTKDTLDKVEESDFKLMANYGSKSIVLNRDNYDFVKYPYGYAFVVIFKDGANCNAIDFKNTPLFRLPSNNSPPKVMYVNWDIKMILLESPSFVNAYMYLGGKWVHIFGYPETAKTVDISEVQQKPHEEKEHKQDSKPQQPPKKPEENSSLRGNNSTESEEDSDSTNSKLTTYVVIGASVLIVLILLLVAFGIFLGLT